MAVYGRTVEQERVRVLGWCPADSELPDGWEVAVGQDDVDGQWLVAWVPAEDLVIELG